MRTTQHVGAAVALMLLGAIPSIAESGAYGFRVYNLDWEENGIYDSDVSEDGVAFGPSFLFRLGEGNEYGLGFDGLYMDADKLERAEMDGRLLYTVSEIFDVSLELRHTWYDVTVDDGKGSRVVGNNGTGLGLGVHFQVPLGESGIFAFGSTRGLAMNMSTDEPDRDDGSTFLWLYEVGIAFARPVEFGVSESSIYFAAGLRHQQNRGGDFDETAEMPFLEAGLRQEF